MPVPVAPRSQEKRVRDLLARFRLMEIPMHDREVGRGRLLVDTRQELPLAKHFYVKYGKRALDILSASAGLAVLFPVFAVVACCIKCTSRGPVFFRQIRVGKGGRPFQILKFRSMVAQRSTPGLNITGAGDARVMRLGKVLRRYKIDEFPQIWNVLRGEMSLVGPRPESPVYVAEYTPEQRIVLSVKPGITGPASLAYLHEEEILSGHEDPELFYRTHVLPDKLARNIMYLQNITLRGDLRIISKTIACSFLRFGNK
jgi:lipopolysaccharide/colanic/teichoic acid biosynthesis glycosyltransferase